MDQSVTIWFEYGLPDDRPFYDLCDSFIDLFTESDIGRYDGHETEMNMADGRFFFYGPSADKIWETIEPLLQPYAFMNGAQVVLGYQPPTNKLTIIDENDSNYKVFIWGLPGKKDTLPFDNLITINPIPEWDDPHFGDVEKYRADDEWRTEETAALARRVYSQWRTIHGLLEGLAASLAVPENGWHSNPNASNEQRQEDNENYLNRLKEELMYNSFSIPWTIRAAEVDMHYIDRMEKAAVIRKAAKDTLASMNHIEIMASVSEEDIDLVRAELQRFRLYFKTWVASFTPDELEDEWGLF
jgi:hypothetical protein